jgi:hypothetical protein
MYRLVGLKSDSMVTKEKIFLVEVINKYGFTNDGDDVPVRKERKKQKKGVERGKESLPKNKGQQQQLILTGIERNRRQERSSSLVNFRSFSHNSFLSLVYDF